jgi:aminoglycoside phosphotransferase (APT) family kinase protein
MSASNQEKQFERLVHAINPHYTLLRTWPVTGGISARVTGVEVEREDGHVQKLLVRQHGAADLQADPQIAEHEFELLRQLHAAGQAVPQPYFVEASAEIFGTPCVVIEFIEGQTEFAPVDLQSFIAQFAAQLARLHQVDRSTLDLPFLKDLNAVIAQRLSERPDVLDETLSEGRVRDALEAAWPWAQHNAPVLLHGDYWPGNLLWREGQLAAVVDWEDAIIGDPLADVAIARLETLWAFGPEAMAMFTQQYLSLNAIDITNLPYWELCVALRPAGKLATWGIEPDVVARMREWHKVFVDEALKKIV